MPMPPRWLRLSGARAAVMAMFFMRRSVQVLAPVLCSKAASITAVRAPQVKAGTSALIIAARAADAASPAALKFWLPDPQLQKGRALSWQENTVAAQSFLIWPTVISRL